MNVIRHPGGLTAVFLRKVALPDRVACWATLRDRSNKIKEEMALSLFRILFY